jgi:hypothetical protein
MIELIIIWLLIGLITAMLVFARDKDLWHDILQREGEHGYIILSLIILALISCVIFGIISFLLFVGAGAYELYKYYKK